MRALDTPRDLCPVLGGLGRLEHVVDGQPAREHRGRRKARCRYCGRTIDLGPAVA
jgi:hypothetical protein